MQVLDIYEYEAGSYTTYTIGDSSAPKKLAYAIELKHNGIEFTVETDTLDPKKVYALAMEAYNRVVTEAHTVEEQRASLEEALNELIADDLKDKPASIWLTA